MQKEIKYRGISRAMSDMGVADGGLAECANMFLDRGELAPIVPPKVITDLPTNISYDLLYIHKSPGFTGAHYIALYSGSIYYVGDDFAVNMLGTGGALDNGETINDIKGVGNTLIVATSTRMRYFLWTTNTVSSGAYKYLGSKIPSIDIKASTEYIDPVPRRPEANPTVTANIVEIVAGSLGVTNDKAKVILATCFEEANHQRITYPDEEDYSKIKACYISENVIHIGNDDDDPEEIYYVDEIMSIISRSIWASIASSIGSAHSGSMLEQPVLLRCAIRLYDGSYINHTVPILLGADTYTSFILSGNANYRKRPISSDWMSWIHNNVLPFIGDSTDVLYPESVSAEMCKRYKIYLQLMNPAAIMEWSDIVKGIDIFLSEPIYLTKYGARIRQIDKTETTSTSGSNVTITSVTCNITYETMTGDEKNDSLIAKSNFYRVRQLDVSELTDSQFQLDELSNKLGDKLVTQVSLPDDYRSNHEIWPEKMYEMNNRLNILNIHTRYFLGPAYPASTLPTPVSGKTVAVRYYIRGEGGRQIVTYRNYGNNHPGAWLVYPDSRCYQADVYITTTSDSSVTKITIPMKEHPLLNCAYSFLGFGIDDLSGYAGVSVDAVVTTTQLLDHAYNKIFQSEVDNPFFFPLAGRHTVAGGRILGVASTTKALSQGQFGQFPLYVFCSEGIWVMETDAAGEFMSIKPVDRVVCNNPNSITGIDGAIVFTSERGLMIIAGSDVRCLSEDMIGKHFRADSLAAIEEIAATHFGSTLPGDVSDDLSFVDYATGCFIGYDFANSRLFLVNPSCPYQYVYAIKDGTWHKMCFGLTFKKALNSYPELYMQCESNDGDAVYDFSIMDDVNDFTTRTFGVVITRALDFDQPYILKTILAMKHRGDFDKEYVGMLLYGSRDGINYIPVHSLKGKSFKFYRVALLAKLLPTERIDRTTVEVVDKFTNKLR